MKLGITICQKCSMNSSRNIYNKCVYCGHPFSDEHHLSDSERKARIREIESTTEQLKESVLREKAREKEREKKQRAQGKSMIIITNIYY